MALQIRDKASIIPLVAGLRRDVLNQVSEGMALVWESYKLDPYVQKLSEVVLLFQEKVRQKDVTEISRRERELFFKTLR